MSIMIDLTGQRFGRLTVVACAGRTKRGNTIWTCRCDCGNEKIVQASHLRSGSIMSCLAPGRFRQPPKEENRDRCALTLGFTPGCDDPIRMALAKRIIAQAQVG